MDNKLSYFYRLKVVLIFMLTQIFIINCSNKETSGALNKPSIDQLIKNMTIKLTAADPRVYAYTDQAGGFWEGHAFAYHPHGGYNIGGIRLLSDFVLTENGRILDRQQAASVEILPHQIRHLWKNGTRSALTVLSGQKAMIVSVYGTNSARFALIPYFDASFEHLNFIYGVNDNMVLISDQAKKTKLALSASAPAAWRTAEGDTFESPPALTERIMPEKALRSEAANAVHFIFYFGEDEKQIKEKAAKIAADPEKFINEKKTRIGRMLLKSHFQTSLPEYDKALHWAKVSGYALIVKQFGSGIWAGLPWFNQSWGRDTFIALPGICLVTGLFDEAAAIIRSFADYQITDPEHPLYGRVPNRVQSPTDIIYNTTDGTPWLIREIAEYVFYTGDTAFARQMFPVIRHAARGAINNFMDGQKFLTHDNADTWMDARIRGKQAWSPRGNRAVDIQALWFNQLRVSAYLAEITGHDEEAAQWNQIAARLKTSFRHYFSEKDTGALYDHLNPDGTAEQKIRPNQMFALTVPMRDKLVTDAQAAAVVQQVVSELTYPYGVASLSQNDPWFHPWHHDQIYHFDAAYHNGMCWQWIAGPVISGMVQTGYQDKAFALTRNLAHQIIELGMPGSMSELVEAAPRADGSIKLSGTYSQAWSVSEFVRNFYQDYLGIRVNMLKRKLYLHPSLPSELNHVAFIYNIGRGEQVACTFAESDQETGYKIYGIQLKNPLIVTIARYDPDNQLFETTLKLKPGETIDVAVTDKKTMQAEINGAKVEWTKTETTLPRPADSLPFQRFRLNPDLKTIKIPDYLEKLRLRESR